MRYGKHTFFAYERIAELLNLLDTVHESAILQLAKLRLLGQEETGNLGFPFTCGETATMKSVLDAIKQGMWDYEPDTVEECTFCPTRAMPGTDEKLSVLAARVEAGLPLWHGHDRTEYDDLD